MAARALPAGPAGAMGRSARGPRAITPVDPARAEALVLIYYGTCGFCTPCARPVTEHTAADLVSAKPNQSPGLIERHGLTRQDVDRFVRVIGASGRRWRGAAASSRVLRSMGGGWPLLGGLAGVIEARPPIPRRSTESR